MRCKFLGTKGTWREVANSARVTIGKEDGEGEPSSHWKKRMLLAEHSPIRQIIIKARWTDLKYWVSVHLVRHWLGIVHWVRTQRTDRTGVDRNGIEQGALVEHEIEANAQAIINISRKRLCTNASPETREAWTAFLNSFAVKQPELLDVCVPDCIYRGYCYEYVSCGLINTEEYQQWLKEYREGINN